ncbi:putative cytochrome-related protein [Halobacteriovorax marinus SJ]|uniref:Cytochrome-related protein n=1 Tax=Halobacteriovorax marinus (strain ATCC BAA-682 / DSM 15412 / SJ) TaxID=862908 RepID=E1X2U7_HALMS|nr:c-type cytochrome [Halobacteriovorax marinus]CBW25142.1 putative cytochrome-related protein [Halobacteriovorax marinus SJ]
MSKKQEPGMAWNMQKLNKIFAFLSVAFLVTVVWVFLDDYIRPWKAVQLKGMEIKKQKLAEKIKAEGELINQEKLAQLEMQLEASQKTVDSRKKDIEVAEEELRVVKKDLKNETIVKGIANSQVSALTFQYGVAHAEHASNADSLYKKLHVKKKEFAESSERMKILQAKEKELKRKLRSYEKEVADTQKSIESITGTKELLMQAKSQLDVNPVFVLRNLPFIDFMDPTLKIQQVVLDNITDDRYFRHVPKVDRCMTCHVFIDQEGYEDQENPYKTHPNLDLMVGAKGKHPMKQFGCTTCHGGEGHRVNDFNSAAHMPHSDAQKKEWEEKYNWHEPHKVPIVQFRRGQYEAGCVKCHNNVEYIPEGTVVNEGKRNIRKFGCYACHKIEGWEHNRKPGPSLEKIASKVSKEFFMNWVWSPKSFNKHAKMPQFFNQTNNNSPEFVKKNITEVNAIAEYVFEKSKKYKPFAKYTGGNIERGKKLVRQVGCMGCHGVEDFAPESKKVDAFVGPYLTGTGSKVKNPDWMVSWLLKPSHFQEDTVMPSFRLSNREANDITAYLMSKKNEKFEELKFEGMDKNVRDELLVEYFSAFDPEEVAKARLAKMSDHERTMELGYRSVGKYGCYSCHSIEGFDGRAPIGPELTKLGSKPLTQFGFGHEKVEHHRDKWIHAHLLNPRRWDNGADKPFKDLLRMPQFYMTEKQASDITVALLGQVSDRVPVTGVKQLDKDEAVVAEGMKVVTKYNCIGCHQIDGDFGDILPLYEDDINQGPPRLVGQGHRVQSDWFNYFLSNVYPIRHFDKDFAGSPIRMPSFNLSNEERNKLVALFQHKSKQKTFENLPAKVEWLPGERRGALKLIESLGCNTCHAGLPGSISEPTAPNLKYAKRRLRPSWIKKWLSNPQAIMEGTLMPSFWEDGESMDTEVFGGDADKQMDALVKYLQEIGEDKFSPNQK